MKVGLIAMLIAVCATAQDAKPPEPAKPAIAAKPADQDEMTELSRELAEAGNSPNDYIRVLEAHLAKYPKSAKRGEIEGVLAKTSLEAKDNERIVKYGELVIARDPSDGALLERVARAHLVKDDAASAEKALAVIKKFEHLVDKWRTQPNPGRLSAAQWKEDLDRATARGLVLEARASGNLGQTPRAQELAQQSYQAYPTAEGARESAKWLAASGDTNAAVERYADAFTLEDPRGTDVDRAKDRRKMSELYTKSHGSEKGLGDIVLAAYDRTSNLLADRAAKKKAVDPNSEASKILDFTLPGVNGNDLSLAKLQGKTIVLDFWATWCGPCKAQRPLYEEVEKKFKDSPNVVFLSVNTDEDRGLVAPFIKSQHWTNTVYFDGGLSDWAKVSSIPTTMIVDKTGQISSRMNGFIPDRFVDLLTARIQETLRQ